MLVVGARGAHGRRVEEARGERCSDNRLVVHVDVFKGAAQDDATGAAEGVAVEIGDLPARHLRRQRRRLVGAVAARAQAGVEERQSSPRAVCSAKVDGSSKA